MCSYAHTCSYQGIDDLGAVSLHIIHRIIRCNNYVNLPITFSGDAISGPTTTKSMCFLLVAPFIFFFTLHDIIIISD